MDSRKRIETVLNHARLSQDERIILDELVRQGYAPNGQPYGQVSAIPARELAELLPEIPEDGDDNAEPLIDDPARPVSTKRTRRRRGEEGLERSVRHAINRLVIKHGIPIMCQAGPGGGYYLPAGDEEVEANHARFHQRAMTGLMKATRSRKSAYADAVLQLAFDFDSESGDKVRHRLGMPPRPRDAVPAWVQIVTKLLDRVKGDPTAYAEEIRSIQERYGDIFVPRYKVRELREELSKVQRMLGDLA